MNKKQEIIRQHLSCTCDEAYKSRNMTDPNCFLCEYESEIELMMDEYAEQQLKNCNLQNVSFSEERAEVCECIYQCDVYIVGHDYSKCPQCGKPYEQT